MYRVNGTAVSMTKSLFAIISTVPERISLYTSVLRPSASNFLFFSNVSSFLARRPYSNLRLIILDNVDEDVNVAECVRTLRNIDAFATVTIVVISKEVGCDCGIAALTAGCNDYLAYRQVGKELAPRVRMHLNSPGQIANYLVSDAGPDLDSIYPLEDRALIQSALWYIKNAMTSVRTVNDLSIYVGQSEREINRVFNEHYGQTAFAFIREYRINRAKEMLLKTRFSITQIAQDVGYSSSANFSTAFKSVVGLSPREYRRQRLSIS